MCCDDVTTCDYSIYSFVIPEYKLTYYIFWMALQCSLNCIPLKIVAVISNKNMTFDNTQLDSAAFDTESQLFLDSAPAEAGVSTKVRRIVQAIFTSHITYVWCEATGCRAVERSNLLTRKPTF